MSARGTLRGFARGVIAAAVAVGSPAIGLRLAEPASETERPVRIEVDAGDADAGEADLSFVGVLLPPQMANLSPKADGKVLALRASVGQPVRQGDVIVAFDLRALRHDLAIAEAQLRVARADVRSGSADVAAAKSKATRRTGSVVVGGERVGLVSDEEAAQSRFEVESAEARLASAQAHVAEQTARVDQLRLALEESELRAPFDGIVSAVNFEPGMIAHPGDVVARLVGGRGLRARIAVPDDAVAQLSMPRARLTLEGRTLYADVESVPPEPDPAARAFVVEAIVEHGTDLCETEGCANLAGRTVRANLVAR